MLGLHYVPGGHDSPVCPKLSATWDFGQFVLCVQVLLGLDTVYHCIRDEPWGKGAADSRRLQCALRFDRRYTTDVSTFPPGPSHSDGVPHVSHLLIKVWHVFHVLSGFLRMKRGCRTALEHIVSPRYKNKASQTIAIIVSWYFDEARMPKMKQILCLHVCSDSNEAISYPAGPGFYVPTFTACAVSDHSRMQRVVVRRVRKPSYDSRWLSIVNIFKYSHYICSKAL